MNISHYDRKYFADRDFLDPKIASAVLQLTTTYNLKTILDVGCGSGKLVNFLNLNNLKAFGVDPHAKLPNKKNFSKASANKLPFKNNSFDLVSSISVIEHLTKAEGKIFLQEAYRILKPDGYIFLVTPNFNSPGRFLLGKKWFGYSDPTHITFYTEEKLTKTMRDNGFSQFKSYFKFKSNFLTYLLFSTKLSVIRDSFWLIAQK